jgi:hypothetical protein
MKYSLKKCQKKDHRRTRRKEKIREEKRFVRKNKLRRKQSESNNL